MDSRPTYEELEQKIKGLDREIDKAKQVNEELLQSESLFQILLEQISNIAVQGYGPDGTIEYWNHANEAIYGYTAEEAIGNNLVELIIPPEMRDFVRVAIAKGEHTGEMPPPGELKLLRKDGSLVDIYSSHAIVQRAGRKPLMFCIDVDISKRKKAEEALRKGEERFKTFFNNANDAIFVHPLNRVGFSPFIEVNDIACQRYGYSKEELLQLSAPDITKKIHAEQHSASDHRTRLLEAGHLVFETVHIKKSGEEFPVEINANIIDQGDGRHVILAIVRDTSKRIQIEEALRKSEAQLRTLIETLPDLVWLKDPEGIYLACNSKFERLFGAKQDKIVGKTDHDFVDKELADFFREKDKAAMAAGKPTMNEEEVVYADDGHRELLETIKTPMLDHNGQLIGVLGVGHDITERKKMEAQLRQAHKMEAVGTMAGGIAHDFNNILAAIIGYADMAKLNIPESSPAKYDIEQVLKAGNRAKDLVQHILTFSRMSSRDQGHSHINLCPIVKEVLKFQRSIIPSTIDIKSDIDENCGQINGDPTQIHQVIMNLCTNALHAMEKKGGTLKVGLYKTELCSQDLKTEPKQLPGNYIQMSVCDTGNGLTPELIDKIFDPYFTTKEVGKGSGMGLAVVQSIIKKHGGFVKVESEQGKGSTFHVFFPRFEEATISEDTDETEDMPTGTERILFVDDEEMLVDIGKTMLEMLGYSVTTKTDSYEALDLFKSDPTQFDLVITDQTMPNLPGSELVKHLLQIRGDIPIILCTGYSSMIDEMKAQEIGVRGYAMKPVDIYVVSRLIRKVLDEDEFVSLQT